MNNERAHRLEKKKKKKTNHGALLGREFDAQGPDGLDDNNLEFIRDLRHESFNLLHQAVDRRLIAGLRSEQRGVR